MKDRILRNKLFILIPAYWACLFDLVITVCNQPKSYWNGLLKTADEENRFIEFVMEQSIFGIFIVFTAWLILIGIIGLFLPDKKLKIFSLFVMIAHSSAASSWLPNFSHELIFGFINALLFIEILSIYEKRLQVNANL